MKLVTNEEHTTEMPEPRDPQHIERLIVRTLNNYPRLSVSMLASHIRPYDKNWRTVLERMVREGLVQRISQKSGNRIIYVHALAEEDSNAALAL